MRKQSIRLSVSLLLLSTIVHAKTPEMVYSTFIGGSGWDYGHAIAVDPLGCAYISGLVYSRNYPTTSGAFDRTFNGDADIQVSKLNEEGDSLIYSTFIGGSGWENAPLWLS